MKNGEDNDATIPFAFWRIQIPAESVKALFKEETDTQQQSARFCRWFRHPVEQDGGYIVQNIAELYAKRSGLSEDSDKEEYDDAVWLFHPLYPLLAQMDDLTENGPISAQEDTSDGDFTRPTFEICTELLLNPCLQAELYRNAVAMNRTSSWRRANTLQELFSDSFLVGGLLQHCEALINKVNNFKFYFNGLYPLKDDLGKLELLMRAPEFGGYSCKKMEYEKSTSNEETNNTEEANTSTKTERITENVEDIHKLVKEYFLTMITLAQQDLKKKGRSATKKGNPAPPNGNSTTKRDSDKATQPKQPK